MGNTGTVDKQERLPRHLVLLLRRIGNDGEFPDNALPLVADKTQRTKERRGRGARDHLYAVDAVAFRREPGGAVGLVVEIDPRDAVRQKLGGMDPQRRRRIFSLACTAGFAVVHQKIRPGGPRVDLEHERAQIPHGVPSRGHAPEPQSVVEIDFLRDGLLILSVGKGRHAMGVGVSEIPVKIAEPREPRIVRVGIGHVPDQRVDLADQLGSGGVVRSEVQKDGGRHQPVPVVVVVVVVDRVAEIAPGILGGKCLGGDNAAVDLVVDQGMEPLVVGQEGIPQ
mmetsp:Transcript_8831/g.21600  ORF Transcript_8831/g.21600 Transcript_8831/m.21600 type:complete len:281 (-) Transcript_8831:99-941(-)